jgi:hypothetical protein
MGINLLRCAAQRQPGHWCGGGSSESRGALARLGKLRFTARLVALFGFAPSPSQPAQKARMLILSGSSRRRRLPAADEGARAGRIQAELPRRPGGVPRPPALPRHARRVLAPALLAATTVVTARDAMDDATDTGGAWDGIGYMLAIDLFYLPRAFFQRPCAGDDAGTRPPPTRVRTCGHPPYVLAMYAQRPPMNSRAAVRRGVELTVPSRAPASKQRKKQGTCRGHTRSC